MKSVISVKNLTKTYRKPVKKHVLVDLFKPTYEDVDAVTDLSFQIEKGESVAFLGPNGAGKTTTIKMLTGLLYPSQGDISILGYKPFERNRSYLNKIGIVFGSKNGLAWDLTPLQSFDLFRRIYDIPEKKYKESMEIYVELLNVRHVLNTPVRNLSLGERMKVELIGSILHRPEVLFLDEPTIGLDVFAKDNMRKFLRQIQEEEKITILLTSHDMDDVEKVCDRVIVINQGQKIYDDSLTKLNQKYGNLKFIKIRFSEGFEQGLLPKLQPFVVEIEQLNAKELSLTVERERLSTLLAALGDYGLDDIDIIPTPLERIIEDVFAGK